MDRLWPFARHRRAPAPAPSVFEAPAPAVVEGADAPVKIAVAGLVKRYPGPGGPGRAGVEAIAGLDLQVREGECCVVVGPSGCGKSTLLRILAGLERPTAGTAAVLHRKRRLPTALVFQGVSLFPWLTVLDNVAYPLWAAGVARRDRHAAARAVLARMGLEGFARAYPAQLSEGMRQRVAIARALVADADVLLMDEPFSALDEPTRLLLQEELQTLLARTGQTVLFVTHSLDEAVLLGDRVLVLSARPATLRAAFDVPFPRPRRVAELRADPRFAALTVAIWQALKDEVGRAIGGG
jgi:NitT/TauT family transport system ATP-binding protein